MCDLPGSALGKRQHQVPRPNLLQKPGTQYYNTQSFILVPKVLYWYPKLYTGTHDKCSHNKN